MRLKKELSPWTRNVGAMLSRLKHGQQETKVFARLWFLEMAQKADLWERELRLRKTRDERKKRK